MDLFKKMFSSKQTADENKENSKKPAAESDEFRKPIWYDDYETDDDLFENNKTVGFQVFTNPIELQKHFEHQLNEMMKTIEGDDETMKIFDRNFREEYLKPGYEDNNIQTENETKRKLLDTDLDGEIYADQLHTLLQRVSPEIKAMIPATILKSETKIKRSEEETIMDRIHGNQLKEDEPPIRRRQITKNPHNGAFAGTFQGPKIFGQSIISQSIRKPDGTLETRRIVRDSEGNTKTTVTRTVNGKTETTTSIENDGNLKKIIEPRGFETGFNILNLDRNMFVTRAGYTLPKNLW